jgi:hypothetical protein
MPLLFISIPTPMLLGVPLVAFLLTGRVSGSQSTSFILDESLFRPTILETLCYPQVEENSLVSPLKSLICQICHRLRLLIRLSQ